MTFEIEEIKKLTLEPNEYLLIRLPKNTPLNKFTAFRKDIHAFFAEKANRVAVVVGAVHLEKIEFKDE